MKKRLKILLPSLCILFLIFYFIYYFIYYFIFLQICPYNSIQRDYGLYKYDFCEAAQYLMNYDYPIVYVSEEYMIDENREQTINGFVSTKLLNTFYGNNLIKAGYSKFAKENGGVYFYKYFNWDGIRGIMYYPDNFSYDNTLISKVVKLDDNWYYFEEN